MAYGIPSFGEYHSHEAPGSIFPYRSRTDFLNQIRQIIGQGLVDIVLMSNSTSETLALEEKRFEGSHVTPAVRANDTTDIHVARGAVYPTVPSRPFRTATLDQIQCGKVQCNDTERTQGPNLGLYSITFNNDLELDLRALEAYKTFRLEAEKAGFRHFLEIFDPNRSGAVTPELLGHYINDQIARTLAAVPTRSRPVFLKTAYHGPRFMQELVHYDEHLVVGVLGGAAGTTFDAFDLLYQSKKYGGRAALFGRKINQAEHQCAFIKFLRMIADDEIKPAEAVRAYHGVLQNLGIKPRRSLRDDMMATVDLMAGEDQSSASVLVPEHASGGTGYSQSSSQIKAPKIDHSADVDLKAEPDFDAMTLEQKLEYNQRRRDAIYG